MKNVYRSIAVLITVLLLSGFVRSDNDIYFQMSKSIDLFGRIYKEVALNYVDNVNPEEFMNAGIKGMLSALDPYTVYLGEDKKEDISLLTDGKYGGIGATVGVQNENVTIVDLIEGYPAQRQGMRIGDVIKKIDSVSVSRENYNELSKYMKGEPGTELNIEVEREGFDEPIIFKLIREEIEIKNLSFAGFYPENSNNVYLKLSGFTRTAGEEVKNALLNLNKVKEVESIVLDLRGNPGGLLDAAIDVSEKFLENKQLIVSVVGRDTLDKKEYFSNEQPIAGNTKLVVLVDNGSASASEIVAGAIQDHDRGVIVGDQSFGKGLVQTLIPLSYDTSLKITTGKYYTPSGRCIQKIDYAKENDVIIPVTSLNSSEFKTDNQRTVYSGGGILPDSIISNSSDSKQMKHLLAQGLFFKFATNYFNVNNTANLAEIKDDEIFKEFLSYIDEQSFEYKTRSEKLIEDLYKTAEESELNTDILNQINNLKKEILKERIRELEKNKEEILSKIKEEIAARINGDKGRIMQSLINDKQFATAIKLLKDEKIYNSFLAFGKF